MPSPPKLKVGNSDPLGRVGSRDGLTIFCKFPNSVITRIVIEEKQIRIIEAQMWNTPPKDMSDDRFKKSFQTPFKKKCIVNYTNWSSKADSWLRRLNMI